MQQPHHFIFDWLFILIAATFLVRSWKLSPSNQNIPSSGVKISQFENNTKLYFLFVPFRAITQFLRTKF